MKKTKRKLLSLAMASAMAASLLTGCGGGGANETTAAAGTEKTEVGKTETEAGSTEAAAEGTADADYSQDVITYGYKINKEILARTDRRYELKEATLYSAFKRLEQAGCIRTYWGDETTGARRRYYSITEKGRETYASNRRDWEEAKELIDRLLDDDGEGTA